MYGIWGVIGKILYTDVYDCVGSTILEWSVKDLLVVSIGCGIGWEEWMPVGMVHEGEIVTYLGNYNDVRGRV